MRPFPDVARWAVVLVLVLAAAVSMAWPVDGAGSSTVAPAGDALRWSYGDDPGLDRLVDGCAAGRARDCDELYWASPVGSRYERLSTRR